MKRTKRSERKDKHLSEWTETEENTTSRQSSSHRNNINQTISQLRNSQNWLIKCQWSRQCNCHLTGHCFCFCLPINFRTIFEIFSEHEKKKRNQKEKKMFELHKWQWIHRIESNRNTKNRKQNSLTRHETISIAAKQHRINIFSKLIGIRCDGSFRLKLKKKKKRKYCAFWCECKASVKRYRTETIVVSKRNEIKLKEENSDGDDGRDDGDEKQWNEIKCLFRCNFMAQKPKVETPIIILLFAVSNLHNILSTLSALFSLVLFVFAHKTETNISFLCSSFLHKTKKKKI